MSSSSLSGAENVMQEDELEPIGTGDKLHPGCNITSAEGVRIIFAFIHRNKLTKSGIAETLELINLFLGSIASVPKTQFLLEKELGQSSSEVKKYFYCQGCKAPVEEKQNNCECCNANIVEADLLRSESFFILFDIRSSLQKTLSIPGVANNLYSNLQKRSLSERSDIIRDITDGEMYSQLGLGEYDVTCCINTDGVSVFKSSTYSIWPVFVSVNELSPGIRRKHTILVALWSGKSKPEFNTFLKPFVVQCNQLTNDGFEWFHDNNEITSKVLFTMVAADSAARCILQGIKQYNGS